MSMGLPHDVATLRKHSTWFIIYGVIVIALGVFSIAAPMIATLAIALTAGWLLLLGGGFGLFAAISAGARAPGFWWHLIMSIVYLLAGLSLLTSPIAGAVTLTVVLAVYLIVGGVIRLMMAFGYRSHASSAWLWLAVSGAVDILLAAIIISGLPGTATWVLGLLVGINLLMMGFAILMVALAVRRTADRRIR